jgi:hypothetical protein
MRVEIKDKPKGVRVGDLPVGALFRLLGDRPATYAMTAVQYTDGQRLAIIVDPGHSSLQAGDRIRFDLDAIVYPVPPPDPPKPAEPETVRLGSLPKGTPCQWWSSNLNRTVVAIVGRTVENHSVGTMVRMTNLDNGDDYDYTLDKEVIPRPDLIITGDAE